MFILSPFCFAVCGQHVSPRIAIVLFATIQCTKLLHVTFVYLPREGGGAIKRDVSLPTKLDLRITYLICTKPMQQKSGSFLAAG